MTEEWIKYAKIKWKRTKERDTIFILQEKFNQYTGKKEETVERPINIPGLNNRIAALNEELAALNTIKNKISRGDFDIVEDNR
jgi:hypothetical protein